MKKRLLLFAILCSLPLTAPAQNANHLVMPSVGFAWSKRTHFGWYFSLGFNF